MEAYAPLIFDTGEMEYGEYSCRKAGVDEDHE